MVEVSKPPPEVTAKTSQSEISTGTKEKKSSKKSKEQRKSKTETNGITDGESDGTVTLYVPKWCSWCSDTESNGHCNI